MRPIVPHCERRHNGGRRTRVFGGRCAPHAVRFLHPLPRPPAAASRAPAHTDPEDRMSTCLTRYGARAALVAAAAVALAGCKGRSARTDTTSAGTVTTGETGRADTASSASRGGWTDAQILAF